MSCCNDDIQCDTAQIIEPRDDLLVDTAGVTTDLDERGFVELNAGQKAAVVTFLVPKINPDFHFEYLYVEAMGIPNAGGVHPIPTIRAREGFAVVFEGAPVGLGYTLHWRCVVTRTSSIVQIDAPEDLYIQLPHANQMQILFVNPRSSVSYGFSELRVENLHDPHQNQAVIHTQVFAKNTWGFSIGINPMPPTDKYFLRVRTP